MAETGPTPAPVSTKDQAAPTADQVVIKKYANRRLYNTGSSSYVTLEHLAELVRKGQDFVVYDARTNEDITRQVLTQIIFEAENSGQNLLPIQFLRQLIRMYGDQIQAALAPSYLEMSLDAFARRGDRMREQMGAPGFAHTPAAEGYRLFEDQIRQNMALFDRAMKMFTPFAYPRHDEAPPSRPPEPEPSAGPQGESLAELKAQLDGMQRQIEKLFGGG